MAKHTVSLIETTYRIVKAKAEKAGIGVDRFVGNLLLVGMYYEDLINKCDSPPPPVLNPPPAPRPATPRRRPPVPRPPKTPGQVLREMNVYARVVGLPAPVVRPDRQGDEDGPCGAGEWDGDADMNGPAMPRHPNVMFGRLADTVRGAEPGATVGLVREWEDPGTGRSMSEARIHWANRHVRVLLAEGPNVNEGHASGRWSTDENVTEYDWVCVFLRPCSEKYDVLMPGLRRGGNKRAADYCRLCADPRRLIHMPYDADGGRWAPGVYAEIDTVLSESNVRKALRGRPLEFRGNATRR
jgi:hypothetical protein